MFVACIGGFGGGRTLTIGGVGFATKDTTTVTVCDNKCPILSITATTITCDVPGNSGWYFKVHSY